jgi:HrpA-like RNA helicase
MGIADPATFEFVTPPDPASLLRATKQLYALGALNEAMDLTEHGRKLAKLPLDPVFGHMLLQGERYSCVKELLTTVALLSSDNLFYRPSGIGPSAARAAAAHKRFKSHEGDIPTFLKVYDCWQREAVYVPPASGGRQAQKRQQKALRHDNYNILLLHEEWCRQNFISSRSLARAYDVRKQLEGICKNPPERNGLGMDVTLTADGDEVGLLKCIAAGLFLQAASRSKVEKDSRSSRGAGDVTSTRGRYRTMVGKIEVNIHPTSTMFARQPAPACVVYTELVATKRSYIRTVTQIREEWLPEVAPAFYKR